MNGTVMTFSILGWALAVGKDLSDAPSGRIDKKDIALEINSAGVAIHSAAETAIRAFPKFSPTPATIRKISESIKYFDSIGYVRPGEKRFEVVLAMLLVALDEVSRYAKKPKRKAAICNLIDSITKLSRIIDPEGDKTNQYIRGDHAFQRWLRGGK